MTDFNYWDRLRGSIYSNIGKWVGGEDVVIEENSLLKNIIHENSYMQLIILNATGKLLPRNVADWIESTFMGLSYPDSRIWCNQVAALSSDSGCSPVTAIASCIMSSDSRVYGGSKTKLTTMDFFKKSYLVYRECGCIAESIKDAKEKNGKPIIIGYVRPVNAKDERIPAYIKRQKDLGIPVGDYLNYALKLEVHLKENFNQTMNIAAYTAAFLLDQGLTPKEGYRIHSFATSAGAIACHRDALNKKPNSFTPLRCEDVIYSGLKKRRIT